jgi:hypothetical protein
MKTKAKARIARGKFGGSVGPLFKLLKPIPMEITRFEDGSVTVWSKDLRDFGCGKSLGTAMDDFGKGLPELWHILNSEPLGKDLQKTKRKLETFIAPRRVPA